LIHFLFWWVSCQSLELWVILDQQPTKLCHFVLHTERLREFGRIHRVFVGISIHLSVRLLLDYFPEILIVGFDCNTIYRDNIFQELGVGHLLELVPSCRKIFTSQCTLLLLSSLLFMI